MKAFDLVKATMKDSLLVAHETHKALVVCGNLVNGKYYLKEVTAKYGKADVVINEPTGRTVFLYLLEE